MKTYYISSTEHQHVDYDVRFYDLDKAKEYARRHTNTTGTAIRLT